MAGLLKSPQQHYRQQRAHVQAVAGGIEAAVQRAAATGQPAWNLLGMGDLVNQAAPGEIGEKVHEKRDCVNQGPRIRQ